MRIRDTIDLGIKGISQRKVRTALTVLTVVIGVAAIVALVSLVAGLSASVSKSLQSIGPSSLYLTPRGKTIFTAADVAEIESFPNVSTVIPVLTASANITVGGDQITTTIVGVDNKSLAGAIGSVNLYSGTTYNETTTPLAVVGYDVAFPNSGQTVPSITLNQPIFLTAHSSAGTKTLTLVPVGILNAYGSSAFISPDSSIFVPLQAAESLANKYSYSALIVKANSTAEVPALDALLTNVYGSSAGIISVEQIASTVASITGSISLLLGAIAGVSLLVAGISILSIMMVSVTERTKEIGILKAIGFRKRDVLALFLTEAVVIGVLGGVVGVLVGGASSFALPKLLSAGSSTSSPGTTTASSSSLGGGGGASRSGGFSGGGGGGSGAVFVSGSGGGGGAASSSSSSATSSFTPVISLSTVILAILIAVIVSVAASLYPAWRAASVDPIAALRSE